MNLILALDLKGGVVVHGRSGARESYRPLDWGLSSSAEPAAYLAALRPRHLYIADLDRIGGTGDHAGTIRDLARQVETCYVDAGFRSMDECRNAKGFIAVLGTETAGEVLGDCPRALLSLDCRDGLVTPWGEDPVRSLLRVRHLAFAGHLLLDISAVGTGRGLDPDLLARVRAASERPLFYGGGVRSTPDLDLLRDAGFDGAIVATAVHRGCIPLDAIRSGRWS
ncbi:MAG TPA: HisA/HisF-related TIM barrel protein [Methanoregulaceae archaeon]|nr:HisA/HisF-related TIM barrel protein [Methanoregulaceae archaeon]